MEVDSEKIRPRRTVFINLIYSHTHTYLASGFDVLFDIFDLTVLLLGCLKFSLIIELNVQRIRRQMILGKLHMQKGI